MPITLAAGEQRQLNVSLTPAVVLPAALYGYVTDSVTKRAIAGAVVEIVGTGGTYRDTTDTAGFYEIVGITPGTYSGQVSATGYNPASF